MENVYAVIERYNYDFANTLFIKLFAKKSDAEKDFKAKVKRERKNSWISRKNNVVEDFSKENLYYDAYVDGCASEYETSIYIKEYPIN